MVVLRIKLFNQVNLLKICLTYMKEIHLSSYWKTEKRLEVKTTMKMSIACYMWWIRFDSKVPGTGDRPFVASCPVRGWMPQSQFNRHLWEVLGHSQSQHASSSPGLTWERNGAAILSLCFVAVIHCLTFIGVLPVLKAWHSIFSSVDMGLVKVCHRECWTKFMLWIGGEEELMFPVQRQR